MTEPRGDTDAEGLEELSVTVAKLKADLAAMGGVVAALAARLDRLERRVTGRPPPAGRSPSDGEQTEPDPNVRVPGPPPLDRIAARKRASRTPQWSEVSVTTRSRS